MEIVLTILTGVIVLYMVLAVIYRLRRNRIVVVERLNDYVKDIESEYLPPVLNRPLKERLYAGVWQLSSWTKKIVPKNKKENYEQKLMEAGYPLGLKTETFLFFRYLVLVIAMVAGLLLKNILVLTFFITGALFLPDVFIRDQIAKRKREMIKELPDILDLLTVSVEAGLSFDGALQKVIEKSKGVLQIEFEKVLQEINMGKPRREALKDMSERINVDDITVFIGAVIQADQLGVSMGNVLRLQSDQVRANRRMKAEETAQKAPIKMLLPMVVFIFPAIMIVLMGPAVIKLLDTF